MPEIVIDVPFAYELLDKIKNKCVKLGFFPDELEKEMPSRYVLCIFPNTYILCLTIYITVLFL